MTYECEYKIKEGKGIYETIINPKIIIDTPMILNIKKKINNVGKISLIVEITPIKDFKKVDKIHFGKYKGKTYEDICKTSEGRSYFYGLLSKNKSNKYLNYDSKQVIIDLLSQHGSKTKEELINEYL